MNRVAFVDTTLRDAHQSLWNGQMTTAMMLPIAPVIDQVGFEALDFMALISMDWCVRNQRENPWERIRLMSEAMPNTPLIVGGVLRNFGNVPDSVTEFLGQENQRGRRGQAPHQRPLSRHGPDNQGHPVVQGRRHDHHGGIDIFLQPGAHRRVLRSKSARDRAGRGRAHFYQGCGRNSDAGPDKDAGPCHQEGNRWNTHGTPRSLLHRSGPGLLLGGAEIGRPQRFTLPLLPWPTGPRSRRPTLSFATPGPWGLPPTSTKRRWRR